MAENKAELVLKELNSWLSDKYAHRLDMFSFKLVAETVGGRFIVIPVCRLRGVYYVPIVGMTKYHFELAIEHMSVGLVFDVLNLLHVSKNINYDYWYQDTDCQLFLVIDVL